MEEISGNHPVQSYSSCRCTHVLDILCFHEAKIPELQTWFTAAVLYNWIGITPVTLCSVTLDFLGNTCKILTILILTILYFILSRNLNINLWNVFQSIKPSMACSSSRSKLILFRVPHSPGLRHVGNMVYSVTSEISAFHAGPSQHHCPTTALQSFHDPQWWFTDDGGEWKRVKELLPFSSSFGQVRIAGSGAHVGSWVSKSSYTGEREATKVLFLHISEGTVEPGPSPAPQVMFAVRSTLYILWKWMGLCSPAAQTPPCFFSQQNISKIFHGGLLSMNTRGRHSEWQREP